VCASECSLAKIRITELVTNEDVPGTPAGCQYSLAKIRITLAREISRLARLGSDGRPG